VESKLGPLGTSATEWPGWLWWWRIWWNKDWQGNRTTRRKPAPAPLSPPQIPLDQTQARTRAAAVRSQRLTASAMARPCYTFVMAYSKYSWSAVAIKHLLFFRPFWIGKIASKCLYIRSVLYVSFNHILISLSWPPQINLNIVHYSLPNWIIGFLEVCTTGLRTHFNNSAVK
jgi:hypothetical protein